MTKKADYVINLKQDTAWQMHKLHFHESIELMLVLGDGGEVFLDKSIYPLKKNMLVVLKSNSLHRTAYNDPDTVFQRYVLHILPSLLQKMSTKETDFHAMLSSSAPCVQLTDEQASHLVELLEQLRVPDTGEGFGKDVRQWICLLEVMLAICGTLKTDSVPEGVHNAGYEKIQPILEYLQENYRESVSLDDLAGCFHISKHYLCHTFKKGTGFSVMEYVIQMRIIEAQRLLRHGASVQEAGDSSGFQSYAHFIRTFNTYTGTSPKQYSKQYRNSDHVR